MTHAQKRILTRLVADAGVSEHVAEKLWRASEVLARKAHPDSEAFLLFRLPKHVDCEDRSNGDQVWAITRMRMLKTVMLRRENQPPTPEALRVARVTLLQRR